VTSPLTVEIISYSSSRHPARHNSSHISAGAPSPSKLQLPALRDACAAVAAGDPANLGGRIDLAEISMALDDYTTAHDLLVDVLSRQPDSGHAHTTMGEWYAAHGDVARAREEWTTGGQLDDAESLLLLGQSYPVGQVPAEIVDRLVRLAPSTGGGARSYAIGWVYFRMKLDRQSPQAVLLPGTGKRRPSAHDHSRRSSSGAAPLVHKPPDSPK
jgi:hypothetical protein